MIPDGSGSLSAVANLVTLDDARNSDGPGRQLLEIRTEFSSSVGARESSYDVVDTVEACNASDGGCQEQSPFVLAAESA